MPVNRSANELTTVMRHRAELADLLAKTVIEANDYLLARYDDEFDTDVDNQLQALVAQLEMLVFNLDALSGSLARQMLRPKDGAVMELVAVACA